MPFKGVSRNSWLRVRQGNRHISAFEKSRKKHTAVHTHTRKPHLVWYCVLFAVDFAVAAAVAAATGVHIVVFVGEQPPTRAQLMHQAPSTRQIGCRSDLRWAA